MWTVTSAAKSPLCGRVSMSSLLVAKVLLMQPASCFDSNFIEYTSVDSVPMTWEYRKDLAILSGTGCLHPWQEMLEIGVLLGRWLQETWHLHSWCKIHISTSSSCLWRKNVLKGGHVFRNMPRASVSLKELFRVGTFTGCFDASSKSSHSPRHGNLRTIWRV